MKVSGLGGVRGGEGSATYMRVCQTASDKALRKLPVKIAPVMERQDRAASAFGNTASLLSPPMPPKKEIKKKKKKPTQTGSLKKAVFLSGQRTIMTLP